MLVSPHYWLLKRIPAKQHDTDLPVKTNPRRPCLDVSVTHSYKSPVLGSINDTCIMIRILILKQYQVKKRIVIHFWYCISISITIQFRSIILNTAHHQSPWCCCYSYLEPRWHRFRMIEKNKDWKQEKQRRMRERCTDSLQSCTFIACKVNWSKQPHPNCWQNFYKKLMYKLQQTISHSHWAK